MFRVALSIMTVVKRRETNGMGSPLRTFFGSFTTLLKCYYCTPLTVQGNCEQFINMADRRYDLVLSFYN